MLPLPFPREAVRDLLGITRALYRAALAVNPPRTDRVQRLLEIGTRYRQALEMGIKYAPDTMGGRAALTKAEVATEALGQLVGESELMVGAILATAARLRRVR